jgi:hypothetical protein
MLNAVRYFEVAAQDARTTMLARPSSFGPPAGDPPERRDPEKQPTRPNERPPVRPYETPPVPTPQPTDPSPMDPPDPSPQITPYASSR